jgi:hypothetical protein
MLAKDQSMAVDAFVKNTNNIVYRWKDPNNIFRTVWKVHNVPALLRFEKTSEGVQEVGRLIEGEILDEQRLNSLVSSSSK